MAPGEESVGLVVGLHVPLPVPPVPPPPLPFQGTRHAVTSGLGDVGERVLVWAWRAGAEKTDISRQRTDPTVAAILCHVNCDSGFSGTCSRRWHTHGASGMFITDLKWDRNATRGGVSWSGCSCWISLFHAATSFRNKAEANCMQIPY